MQVSHVLQRRPQHYSAWIANVQKHLQNHGDFSRQTIVKNVNVSFLDIILDYYFSLEAVLQDMAKNNPTEK